MGTEQVWVQVHEFHVNTHALITRTHSLTCSLSEHVISRYGGLSHSLGYSTLSCDYTGTNKTRLCHPLLHPSVMSETIGQHVPKKTDKARAALKDQLASKKRMQVDDLGNSDEPNQGNGNDEASNATKKQCQPHQGNNKASNTTKKQHQVMVSNAARGADKSDDTHPEWQAGSLQRTGDWPRW